MEYNILDFLCLYIICHASLDCIKGECQSLRGGFDGQVLAARKRARYLRLARPPTSTELQSVRSQIKRRTHLHKTIRSLCTLLFV